MQLNAPEAVHLLRAATNVRFVIARTVPYVRYVQNKQQLSPACTSVFNRPRGASVDRERWIKTQSTNY